jgi:hypothetical protein
MRIRGVGLLRRYGGEPVAVKYAEALPAVPPYPFYDER